MFIAPNYSTEFTIELPASTLCDIKIVRIHI